MRSIKYYIFLITLLLFTNTVFSQKVTKVTGKVIDAKTKEALPFVDIQFVGTYTGTSTDLDGKFSIQSNFGTDSLKASFIGYAAKSKFVKTESKQVINFELDSESLQIETVEISAKKEKYSRKNNPAVDLIKKVMDSKKENHLKALDYYSYDKYDNVQLDLNNLTDNFRESEFMQQFSVVFDYIDTSKVNGRTYLPLFMRETKSKYFYRKNPKSEKEIREGIKISKFDDNIDLASVDDIVDLLYQDIDLYESKIKLLDHQFISPLSSIAPIFYRFYILDTTEINDQSVINLAFIPRIKENLGFTGNLYVSNDERNSIVKIDMGIRGEINLNFVRDLQITQEFVQIDSAYVLSKDELTIDYALTQNGIGFFGTRKVDYANFNFDESNAEDAYSGVEKIVTKKGAYEREDNYWSENRLTELTENQSGLYEMMDSLKRMKSYRRMVYLTRLITTGYAGAGPIDIGSVPTFVSFNDVEGFKPKIGGETNFGFSKKLRLKGYLSYGLRDKRWKYLGNALFSFNDDYFQNPLHQIEFGYSRETSFPGQKLQFINEDNVLLSIRRGVSDKMLFSDTYKTTYTKEGATMDYSIIGQVKKDRPYGTLSLPFTQSNGAIANLESVNTTEIGFKFKYAPNAQFVQGREYRVPIYNEYPIFNVEYSKGIDGILGGEYDYHKLYASVFKRFYWGILGYTNLELESGKIWGDVPFILMNLPRANQTYAYQRRTYNMMNFLEFVSDEFVSIRMAHFFQGFIFNRLPLLRRLKLREVVTFKAIYGRISDSNNPNLPENGHLIQLPTDENGVPTTYLYDNNVPYIEASVGIKNIFKVLRFDLIKRFTYLDHPNVPRLFNVDGLGIRVRFKVEF